MSKVSLRQDGTVFPQRIQEERGTKGPITTAHPVDYIIRDIPKLVLNHIEVRKNNMDVSSATIFCTQCGQMCKIVDSFCIMCGAPRGDPTGSVAGSDNRGSLGANDEDLPPSYWSPASLRDDSNLHYEATRITDTGMLQKLAACCRAESPQQLGKK